MLRKNREWGAVGAVEKSGLPDCYVLVRSVTYAQKLWQVLTQIGMKAYRSKSPKNLSVSGCGYSVIVKNADIQRVLDAIVGAGMPPFRIYTTRDGERFQEYTAR